MNDSSCERASPSAGRCARSPACRDRTPGRSTCRSGRRAGLRTRAPTPPSRPHTGLGVQGIYLDDGGDRHGPLSSSFPGARGRSGRPTFPAVARGSTHSEQKSAPVGIPRTGASQRPRRRARSSRASRGTSAFDELANLLPTACGRSPRRTRGRARPGRQCRPSNPASVSRHATAHSSGSSRLALFSSSAIVPPSRAPHRCITARRPRGRRRHPPPRPPSPSR